MPPLLAIALKVFPEIVRYMGPDGRSPIAAAASELVESVTRTRDPAAAEQALADPATESDLRMKLAEIAAKAEAEQRQLEFDRLREILSYRKDVRASELETSRLAMSDTENARAFAARLGTAGGPMAIGSLSISFIVAVSFVGMLAFLSANPSAFTELGDNAAAMQFMNITFGALTAAFATVVSFWLGSSQGSRSKDEAAFRIQSHQAQQQDTLVRSHAGQAERLARQAIAGAEPEPQGKPSRSAGERFEQCVEIILQKEGGYVDHPSDPGGATNMGITFQTLRDWRGEEITKDDVKALTVEEAKDIYYAKYWNALRCDELAEGVDLVVFDFGVNAGVGQAAKTLQRCVGAGDDGVIGPITIGAARAFKAEDIIRKFGERRRAYYGSLSTFRTFGKGWLARVQVVEAAALAMVLRAVTPARVAMAG